LTCGPGSLELLHTALELGTLLPELVSQELHVFGLEGVSRGGRGTAVRPAVLRPRTARCGEQL